MQEQTLITLEEENSLVNNEGVMPKSHYAKVDKTNEYLFDRCKENRLRNI